MAAPPRDLSIMFIVGWTILAANFGGVRFRVSPRLFFWEEEVSSSAPDSASVARQTEVVEVLPPRPPDCQLTLSSPPCLLSLSCLAWAWARRLLGWSVNRVFPPRGLMEW